jgi:hypothetical protein
MKPVSFLALLLMATISAFAQAPCVNHPIFTVLDHYSTRTCSDKEKDKLSLYQDYPGGVTKVVKKEGRLLLHNFKFDGEYENRPPVSQILKFHADAAKKAGIEIMSKTDRAMYFKATKDKTTYWIYLTTDGTGDYFLYTIVEPAAQ